MTDAPLAVGDGALTIRLHLADGRVVPEIVSARPVLACRLLEGRPVQQAIDLLPRVFTLCGTAQTHAGVTAAERALGIVPAAPHRAARRLLLLAETAREHAWRLLLDWPLLIGEAPAAQGLKPVLAAVGRLPASLYRNGGWTQLGGGTLAPDREAIQDAVRALADAIGTAIGPHSLLDGPDPLLSWSGTGCTVPARSLRTVLDRGWADSGADTGVGGVPGLSWPRDDALDRWLAKDHDGLMSRTPNWNGAVFETGPLVRQRDQPAVAGLVARFGTALMARLAARLIELIALPDEMTAVLSAIEPADRCRDAIAGDGTGLVQIEMARGRLIHRVELTDGSVTRYQVVAPTEWNFHPAGPLVRAVSSLPPTAVLEDHVRWLVTALDPCVAYRIISVA